MFMFIILRKTNQEGRNNFPTRRETCEWPPRGTNLQLFYCSQYPGSCISRHSGFLLACYDNDDK